MKLIAGLALLGIASSGASAATVVPSHAPPLLPMLAAAGVPVPEPATLGVLGIGAASLILRRRRNIPK